MRSPLLFLALSAALSACATAPATRSAPTPRQDYLSAAEIARTPHRDLLSALQVLRPAYLNPRGMRGPETIVAYIDGIRVQDGVRLLSTIPIEAVAEVRHLSAIDATTRYGVGHSAGAILVLTHRGLRR